MPTTPPSGVNDPPYYNDSGGVTGAGSGDYSTAGHGSSYIPGYSNLPAGITNAGGPNGAYSAYTRTVQPDQLTSQQLAGLLNPGNQYIDMARSAGLDTANDRGMLNGSIAAGASQRAAIQAAEPIAQADAGAYSTAAGQNLDALNTILQTHMNNQTSENTARIGAGAQMYSANLGLLNSRENRTFQGDQAGINRSFQDYMEQQGFGQSMRAASFNLGGNLLQGSQNFNNNLMLQASQNPFMMQDPQALSGFMNFANQGASSYYGDLFGYAMNGGQQLPQWQENNPWYTTPDYSQQYGDGQYAGGGPQLPYGVEPLNIYNGGGQ